MLFMNRFKANQEGATVLEYALIAGLISIVLITAMTSVAPKIAHVFDIIGAAMDGS